MPRVLAGARLARLAYAHENQPYIVPVYLAYHEASGCCLYGFTTPGQKIEWMRANALVCVEVDEIAAYDQWVSVIAIGEYKELPKSPGSDSRASGPERVHGRSAKPCTPGLLTAASAGMTRRSMTSGNGPGRFSRRIPHGRSRAAAPGSSRPPRHRRAVHFYLLQNPDRPCHGSSGYWDVQGCELSSRGQPLLL